MERARIARMTESDAISLAWDDNEP